MMVTHIGPRYAVQSNIAAIKQNYNNAIADNIAQGPFGAAGYLIGKDRGSFVGAPIDLMMYSFGGLDKEGYLSKSRVTIASDVSEENKSVDIYNGKFAQPNHSNDFSLRGQEILGVKSIDQAVVNLKNGTWTTAKLPIDYVVRDGKVYYLNTRSIATLTEAGIPKSKWVFQNQTGVKMFEDNLTDNLNGSSGYTEVTNRQTGKKTKL